MNFAVVAPAFKYSYKPVYEHANGSSIISFNGKTFRLMEKLGQGGYGEVYKAKESSTGEYYAVKVIDKRKLMYPHDASREIHIMQNLDHPNVIKLYGAVEMWGHEFGDSIYLFMKYASRGTLHDYIINNDIDEYDAKKLFFYITFGVKYLHSQGIAHRDLKPQNILLDENGTIRIADFGLSKKFEYHDEMFSYCGTRGYRAPEVATGAGYYGCRAAPFMYSMGIILYDITTKYGTQEMSRSLKSLYKKLTSIDPFSRPLIDEFYDWL